jgi:hypothetical protein
MDWQIGIFFFWFDLRDWILIEIKFTDLLGMALMSLKFLFYLEFDSKVDLHYKGGYMEMASRKPLACETNIQFKIYAEYVTTFNTFSN